MGEIRRSKRRRTAAISSMHDSALYNVRPIKTRSKTMLEDEGKIYGNDYGILPSD